MPGPLFIDSPPAAGVDVNNFLGARNVYPAYPGATTGGLAASASPYSFLASGSTGEFRSSSGMASAPGAIGPVSGAIGQPMGGTSGGVFGQPLTWWAVFVGLFLLLGWAARKYSSEGEAFATIKLSIVNVVTIGLAAAVFLGLAKAVFGKYHVPGLSDFIVAL